MIAFGLIDFTEDVNTYIGLCFLCRYIEGTGNCCLNSASSAIISSAFEDNMGQVMGL
jgi:hypothetical protein